MENLIKHGPLDPVPVKDQPNPSDLDSITNANSAKSIEGHTVVLRVPMAKIESANEGGESKYGK